MKQNAIIAGVGMTRFGKHLDRSLSSLAHEAIGDYLRRLHEQGVALVLCEATGPGWIVSYREPAQ